MSSPLPSGVKDAGNGKGLGLFASRHYKPGNVLVEEEALFRRNEQKDITAAIEYVHFLTELMQWYDCLIEKSPEREVVEHALFKIPSHEMLQFLAPTQSQLETHNPAFPKLNEELKVNALHGLTNFHGGVRRMHDDNDRFSGFSVHCSFLNHSCNPNAILCTYSLNAEESESVMWKIGRIQIRAVRPIKAGEEITVSYNMILRAHPQFRRQYLREFYYFDCTCHLCKNETISSNQTISSSQQLISLWNTSPKVLVNAPSTSHVYRGTYKFCSNAAAMGYNDRPFLDIYLYATNLAKMHDDRLREKYFLVEAERWCRTFYGEEHAKTSNLRERIDGLHSLGVPSINCKAKVDVRPLVFMLDHPDDDDRYYFLKFDKGVLSEVVESQNNPVRDSAAEAARIEQSRTSLLREVEAEAEQTEKQKSKKREKKMKAKANKKQVQQAAETSSNDQEPPQTAALQNSSKGQPTPTSSPTDVPKDTTVVEYEETAVPPTVSGHPTSSDSQKVDSEKQVDPNPEPAKAKQQAAETTPDFYTYPLTPPKSTEERSASSSSPHESLSASPPAVSKQVVPQTETQEAQAAGYTPVKFSLRDPPTLPALPQLSLLFPHAAPAAPN